MDGGAAFFYGGIGAVEDFVEFLEGAFAAVVFDLVAVEGQVRGDGFGEGPGGEFEFVGGWGKWGVGSDEWGGSGWG